MKRKIVILTIPMLLKCITKLIDAYPLLSI